MYCPNCNSDINDNSRFCPNCGFNIEAYKQNDAAVSYSNSPSNNANQMVAYETETVPVQEIAVKPKKKFTINIVAIVLAIAIVASSVFAVFYFRGRNENKQAPLIYATENELFVCKSLGSDKADTIEITDDYAGNYLLSKDCSYIVYTADKKEFDDDYDGYDDRTTFDIYLKKLYDEKNEPTLITKSASDLIDVIGNVDKVVFEKNNSICYADNTGDSTKLAKDYSFSTMNIDKTKLLCSKLNENRSDNDELLSTTYDIGIIDLSTNKLDEIDTDVTSFSFSVNDKITYLKGESLYCADFNGDKKSVAKDVVDFSFSGTNLYYTQKNKDYTLYDLVKDPYAKSDENISEPLWENYEPNRDNYTTEEYDEFWDEYVETTDSDAYGKAYKKAEEKYDADWDEYSEAQKRIELRDELKQQDFATDYTLSVYKDGQSTEILKNVSNYASPIYDISCNVQNGYSDSSISCNAIYLCTYQKELSSIKKVDISKLTDKDVDDIYSDFENNIKYNTFLVNDTKPIFIDEDSNKYYYTFKYVGDKNEFLIKKNNNSDEEYDKATIYTLSDGADTFDEAKEILTDDYSVIYLNNQYIIENDYDSDSMTCTLTVNGNKINDVLPYEIMYSDPKKDEFIFITDYDPDKSTGTVNKYFDGQVTKIIDDSTLIYFTEYDGKYVALVDYDSEEGIGDLVCIDGDNTYKIDSNVKFASTIYYSRNSI